MSKGMNTSNNMEHKDRKPILMVELRNAHPDNIQNTKAILDKSIGDDYYVLVQKGNNDRTYLLNGNQLHHENKSLFTYVLVLFTGFALGLSIALWL